MTVDADDQEFSLSQRLRELVDLAVREDWGDSALLDAFQALTREESRRDSTIEALRQRIIALPDHVEIPPGVSSASSLPGGHYVHRAIGRATARHDRAVLALVQSLTRELSVCLTDVVDLDVGPIAARLDHLAADLEAALSRLDEVRITTGDALGRLEAVEARLGRLEAVDYDAGYKPWFSQVAFGNAFRGARSDILDRYHDLADIAAATGGPVLDLGCGRGEFIELMVTRGIQATGVELDPELSSFCRSLFLDVATNDGMSALRGQVDGSLGAVILIQVVEHLSNQQLIDIVPVIKDKLRPGGITIVETVNATSPYVFTQSFYIDPTHTNPVHHEYLRFLFTEAGFRETDIQWRSPVPEGARLGVEAEGGGLADDVNHGFDVINQFLFGAQDYALIATR